MERLITILGPTAVGKTDLTLALAKAYGAEIISGDAYQVYKGLTIGTAKPNEEELHIAPHHLIDILEPNDTYSVSLFQRQAKDIIARLNDKGTIPILSGGTGLYVQSLLENYNFNDIAPNVELREQLDILYEERGIDGLRHKAEDLADKGGIQINYTDKHRLYRAIELMEAGHYEGVINQTKDGLSYMGPVIGLERSRDDLYERINRRVDIMIDRGLVDEVRFLLHHGVQRERQAFKGIGYKEMIQYIDGHITLHEAIELIKKHTRHFAKRQITWYKRMPYIKWIYIDSSMTELDIFEQAQSIITKNLGI
ncbi:tRNA (adenosine(37)-N6)-dimethylallyltransferase MiaA [Veillonella agrestimuris]|uniref:tRNA (adenosine(37)-N6)-dimethylallyltransferase MiaA n=1 Tax=Veillonella agrestimuris TaxID=2941340 RepID=UPI002041B8C5|nr:tRNA (adenosine(37)-N6)-dimethylallyltransferase MiaA [Veillonella agrestimuris]